MKYKCVIFDMDGTLIDSEKFYQDAQAEAFVRHGIEVSKDSLKRFSGLTGEKRFALMDEFTGSRELSIEVDKTMDEITEVIFKTQVAPFKEGAVALLEACRAKGLKVGLATATPTDIAVNRLNDINAMKYFDFLCYGDNVENPKPQPDIYHLAVEKSGFTHAECFAVEDSIPGVAAASSAGLYTVQICDYIAKQPGADWHILHLDELRQWVESL